MTQGRRATGPQESIMTKNDLTFGAALLAVFATIITAIVLEAGRTPDAPSNHYAHAAVRQVQPK